MLWQELVGIKGVGYVDIGYLVAVYSPSLAQPQRKRTSKDVLIRVMGFEPTTMPLWEARSIHWATPLTFYKFCCRKSITKYWFFLCIIWTKNVNWCFAVSCCTYGKWTPLCVCLLTEVYYLFGTSEGKRCSFCCILRKVQQSGEGCPVAFPGLI